MAVNPASTPATSTPDLADVQGNILAGFSKDNVAIVALTFSSPASGRKWLASAATFAARHSEVADFNRLFKEINSRRSGEHGVLQATWVQILLTGAGLQQLGVAQAEVQQLSPSLAAGMASAAADLGDTDESDPSKWVGPFGKNAVHAILIIASDSEPALLAEVSRRQHEALQLGVEVGWIEEGHTLPAPLTGHEHFGFKDGASQPAVQGIDDDDPSGLGFVPMGEFVFGFPGVDGQVRQVPGWAIGGTLVAFRRIRQDVAGFRAFVGQEASTLGMDVTKVGAKLVGRWASGAPVDAAPDADDPALAIDSARNNHFDYSTDSSGTRTPRFAHIRKANPRAGNPDTLADTQRRRIIRRGIPYGDPLPATGATPEQEAADRGLLFFCCQASIEDQFVFIQKTWVNNPNFPGGAHPAPNVYNPPPQEPPDGEDPIEGMHHGHGHDNLKVDGQPDRQIALTQQFVTVTAGEYLFAPSVPQLAAWGGQA
jgi:Dyp-type peroxidase family